MRQRLFIAMLLLLVAEPARGDDFVWTDSPAWLSGPSVMTPDSVLMRPFEQQPRSGPRHFSTRSTPDSVNGVIRTDYTEPEPPPLFNKAQAPFNQLDEEPFEDGVQPLKAINEPIMIDGAADKAAKKDDDDDDDPADWRGSFAWIAGSGNQLGILEWSERELALYEYAVNDKSRFFIDPGFVIRWLNGPSTTDLPPYLFSIFADTGISTKLQDNWGLNAVISPSWNTDFANKGYKLFRLPWQVANSFQVNEEWTIVAGLTDLAREDIRLLPIAGFNYYSLDGSKQFDLVFPRPKMAWRLSRRDSGNHWVYVAGELGGGSFSILRSDRQNDIVTLRDYRLLCGYERRREKGNACRIEAGWVFGRAVEYQSNIGNYNPGDTAIIRISSDY